MKFYTDIVKKSWQITWRHKVLWIFGLFVSLWGGKGIEAELNSARRLASETSPLNPAFWSSENWSALLVELSGDSSLTLMAIVMAIALLIVVAMVMLSQTGVIDAVNQFADKDGTSERYALHHAWVSGKKHFWVVLSLNLLSKGLSYLLLALALMPLFTTGTFTHADAYWVLFSLLLYIPVGIIISIVTRYALNHAVLNDEHALVGARHGWNMFRQNIGVSIELAIVMFFVFLGIVLLVVPVIAAVLTLPSLMLLFADAPAAFGLPWVYLHDRLYIWVFLTTLYAASVLFSVWHVGSWTMLYKELARGNRTSKTHRWLKGNK